MMLHGVRAHEATKALVLTLQGTECFRTFYPSCVVSAVDSDRLKLPF